MSRHGALRWPASHSSRAIQRARPSVAARREMDRRATAALPSDPWLPSDDDSGDDNE